MLRLKRGLDEFGQNDRIGSSYHKKIPVDNFKNEDEGFSFKRFFKQFSGEGVRMEENHIYFRTEVNRDSISELCDMINEYTRICERDKKTNKFVSEPLPLYLHISSMGGDLLQGFLAYDHIKNCPIPIYTVGEGYTVSSGSVMFMAGHRRLMTRHSYFLAHQLSQTVYGTLKSSEVMDDALNNAEFMTKLYHIYLDNIRHNSPNVLPQNRLTKEKLEAHMMHDIYWSFEKCFNYGIIDGEYVNYVVAAEKDMERIQSGCNHLHGCRVEHNCLTDKHVCSGDHLNKGNQVDKLKEMVPSKDIMKFIEEHTKKTKTKNNVASNLLAEQLQKYIMGKMEEDEDEDEDEEEEKEKPVVKRVVRPKKRTRKN